MAAPAMDSFPGDSPRNKRTQIGFKTGSILAVIDAIVGERPVDIPLEKQKYPNPRHIPITMAASQPVTPPPATPSSKGRHTKKTLQSMFP